MVTARCEKCGARLDPSATWCSLCLTPVAPGAVPAPSADVSVQPPSQITPAAPTSPPAPLSQLPPPTTPPVILGTGGARAPGPGGETAVPEQRDAGTAGAGAPRAVDADAMLAELAASEGYRRGGLSAAMSSRRNRYAAAAVATAAILCVFVLVIVVLMRFAG